MIQRLIPLLFLLLFSGCVASVDGSNWSKTTTDASHPGLVLKAEVARRGSEYDFTGTATNGGSTTYRVSAICEPEWDHELRSVRTGQRVWPPAQAYCAAFGLKDFAPGDVLRFDQEWAPPASAAGDHDWTLTLKLRRTDESPVERASVTVRIHVKADA